LPFGGPTSHLLWVAWAFSTGHPSSVLALAFTPKIPNIQSKIWILGTVLPGRRCCYRRRRRYVSVRPSPSPRRASVLLSPHEWLAPRFRSRSLLSAQAQHRSNPTPSTAASIFSGWCAISSVSVASTIYLSDSHPSSVHIQT
jgi:hypothetical protein